jgi:hypothetical protein
VVHLLVQPNYGDNTLNFYRCLSLSISHLVDKHKYSYNKDDIRKGTTVESASRPLVDFGVFNDNLIKRLILCVKCLSRF